MHGKTGKLEACGCAMKAVACGQDGVGRLGPAGPAGDQDKGWSPQHEVPGSGGHAGATCLPVLPNRPFTLHAACRTAAVHQLLQRTLMMVSLHSSRSVVITFLQQAIKPCIYHCTCRRARCLREGHRQRGVRQHQAEHHGERSRGSASATAHQLGQSRARMRGPGRLVVNCTPGLPLAVPVTPVQSSQSAAACTS